MIRLPGCFPLQRAVSAAYGRIQLISTAATTCVPVVIAGAGPTGLVLSSLLSQYGACAPQERQPHIQGLQAEHFHNSCFQLYGVLCRHPAHAAGQERRRHPAPSGALHEQQDHGGRWQRLHVVAWLAFKGTAAATLCLPTPSQHPAYDNATLHTTHTACSRTEFVSITRAGVSWHPRPVPSGVSPEPPAGGVAALRLL